MGRRFLVCLCVAACTSNAPVRAPAVVEPSSVASSVASSAPSASAPPAPPGAAPIGRADASAPLVNVDGGTTPSQRPEAFDLEAAKAAAQAANQLGFAVYARFPDANGNAFFSPASLAIALGMLSSGARGQTLEEMRHVLHAEAMPAPDSAFSALLASMTVIGTRDETSLKIENRLWAQQGAHFNPDFLSRMKNLYSASVDDVDFAHDSPRICRAIDRWATDFTQGRVSHVFDRCDGPLMLADAIHFKGRWDMPFNPQETVERDFRTRKGTTVRVSTMIKNQDTSYAHVDGVQMLGMAYRGGLTMVVAVPDDPRRLHDIEQHLGTAHAQWLSALAEPTWDTVIYLPRWKTQAKFELGDALRAAGMKRAFTADADFSGMKEGTHLTVAEVVQGASIEVDESGTTASAVTGVGMVMVSASLRRAEFRADRPFLYFIEDRTTGAILFMGRVVDPR